MKSFTAILFKASGHPSKVCVRAAMLRDGVSVAHPSVNSSCDRGCQHRQRAFGILWLVVDSRVGRCNSIYIAVWPCCGFYLLPFGDACCRRDLSQTSTCNSCSHFPSHSWTGCRRCHRCCDMPYSAWNSLHFPATDSHLSSVAETSTFVSSGRMWCHECFSILQ